MQAQPIRCQGIPLFSVDSLSERRIVGSSLLCSPPAPQPRFSALKERQYKPQIQHRINAEFCAQERQSYLPSNRSRHATRATRKTNTEWIDVPALSCPRSGVLSLPKGTRQARKRKAFRCVLVRTWISSTRSIVVGSELAGKHRKYTH